MNKESFDKLLELLLWHQKENGEFGRTRNAKVVSVVRNYHNNEGLIDKPQVFITVMAIEQLGSIDKTKYYNEINKALEWLHFHTQDGFFYSQTKIEEPTDSFVNLNSNKTKRTIKVKVIRHLAEALVSFLRFEPMNLDIIQIIDNLILLQNDDGGWSNTEINKESQLLSTVFCTNALSKIPLNNYLFFFSKQEQAKKNLHLTNSINKAITWLIDKNKIGKGYWYLPDVDEDNKYFYSGILFNTIPEVLLEKCHYLLESTVNRILRGYRNGGWYKNGELDFDGTVRILSGLIKLKKNGLVIDEKILLECKNNLKMMHLDYNSIDPTSIGYLIEIFSSNMKTVTQNINANNKPNMPLKIFLSYSKSDVKLKEELDKHLVGLKNSNKIISWHDGLILPGEMWNFEIRKAIKEANLILLLISVDFLNTDYIQRVEVKDAMKRHSEGTVKIVPIILKPCDWTEFEFAKFNALPSKAVPLTNYSNRDKAFLEIVNGLKKII